MDEIINIINNENLTLDELGEIVKEALAKMYSKLEDEIGLHNPIGVITSFGCTSHYVAISFIDGGDRRSGESYEQTYHI